jgi:hypothetical protein
MTDERLERLSWQLSQESLGPIANLLDEMRYRASSAGGSLIAWLRQSANEQPLITILLAGQMGYLAARLGRHHARR